MALALIALGEGLLGDQNLKEARKEFESIQKEYNEKTHPLAIAGALRGLGRIALQEGDLGGAIFQLEKAAQFFGQLKRKQELARTVLYLAQALRQKGENKKASSKFEEALKAFHSFNAQKDLERALKFLKRS